jgi:hypothetical protein
VRYTKASNTPGSSMARNIIPLPIIIRTNIQVLIEYTAPMHVVSEKSNIRWIPLMAVLSKMYMDLHPPATMARRITHQSSQGLIYVIPRNRSITPTQLHNNAARSKCMCMGAPGLYRFNAFLNICNTGNEEAVENGFSMSRYSHIGRLSYLFKIEHF